MAKIDRLSHADTLAAGDLLPIYQQANNDTRAVPVGVLAASLQDMLDGEPDETVYSLAMAGASFSMAVTPATPGGSVWAQVSLNATAPNGTITLPDADHRTAGQEVLVTSNQAITALTLIGLGANVVGAPTGMTANGFFRLRYDSVANTWFRVG